MKTSISRRAIFRLGATGLAAVALAHRAFSADTPAAPVSLLGRWQAVDNETRKVYGVVEFVNQGNTISGIIRQYTGLPGEAVPTVCPPQCPPDKAGKPVVGLEAIWGLRRSSNATQFDDGYVVDPKDGTQLRCKITLAADGRRLTIRFHMGMPFLGESETWIRLDT